MVPRVPVECCRRESAVKLVAPGGGQSGSVWDGRLGSIGTRSRSRDATRGEQRLTNALSAFFISRLGDYRVGSPELRHAEGVRPRRRLRREPEVMAAITSGRPWRSKRVPEWIPACGVGEAPDETDHAGSQRVKPSAPPLRSGSSSPQRYRWAVAGRRAGASPGTPAATPARGPCRSTPARRRPNSVLLCAGLAARKRFPVPAENSRRIGSHRAPLHDIRRSERPAELAAQAGRTRRNSYTAPRRVIHECSTDRPTRSPPAIAPNLPPGGPRRSPTTTCRRFPAAVDDDPPSKPGANSRPPHSTRCAASRADSPTSSHCCRRCAGGGADELHQRRHRNERGRNAQAHGQAARRVPGHGRRASAP